MHERTRHWARLEKLLERALIKISAVASSLDTDSTRAMIEALIAGQRNPKALAGLAIGRMRPKRAQLAEALDGRFESHHGELARIVLDQIDALTAQIDQLTAWVTELIEAIPVRCQKSAWPVSCSDGPGPAVGHDDHPCLSDCSTSSSSGSAAGLSCSAGHRPPRTWSCSGCGTRSPCCAALIRGPGWTGPTARGPRRTDPAPAGKAPDAPAWAAAACAGVRTRRDRAAGMP